MRKVKGKEREGNRKTYIVSVAKMISSPSSCPPFNSSSIPKDFFKPWRQRK